MKKKERKLDKLTKYFNLWLFVTLPIVVFILNQINVILSLAVLCAAYVWSISEYDSISQEYRKKEILNKRNGVE